MEAFLFIILLITIVNLTLFLVVGVIAKKFQLGAVQKIPRSNPVPGLAGEKVKELLSDNKIENLERKILHEIHAA